ncbi:hypothetical protein GW17_00050306 [Ensete ventricosum]|nr:hypothetical protein GW17_00050306 [Ensete ventricosum]
MGIKSVLVSGDREEAVTSVGKMVGIGTINAALTPQQKSSIISSLQAEGHRVAMIVDAISLAQATMAKVHQNLAWAVAYNVVAIPIAAGVLLPNFDFAMTPSVSAVAPPLPSPRLRKNVVSSGWVAVDPSSQPNCWTPRCKPMVVPAMGPTQATNG